MNSHKNHIIGKQFIEISFDNLEDSFGVQDRIAAIYYEELQPRMEILFDEMFDKDRVVVIDRLEVDCEILNKNNWEKEWVETSLRKLKDQLRQADKKTRLVTDCTNEFLFYLQHGYLAWNSRIRTLIQFEKELIIDHLFVRSLADIINQDARVARRLTHYFSEHLVAAIIEKLIDEAQIETYLKKEIIDYLLEQTTMQSVIAEALIVSLSVPASTIEEFRIRLAKIMNRSAVKENKLAGEKELKKRVHENSDEAIYINNAGLVILHPFFQQFFEQLKFTNINQWIDDQKKQQAVIIMHHLATGLNEFEEFDLVLAKILCGLEPQDVITEDISITKELQEACDALIREVIVQWTALKNTGVDAFRNTFIQRRAKLSRVDNGWLLQVERNAVDILLGSLPWGLGVIRLPWMKEILFTEWV